MLKNQCKPLLVEIDRKDLLVHVRQEIVELQESLEATEEELTAGMVVDSLMEKYPEKIVFERKVRELTDSEKKYAKML